MRVQVYTNNEECQKCKATKHFLEKFKIKFDYNVVSEYEMNEIGNKYSYIHVPIVTFDNNLVIGDAFTIANEIKRLLND